MDFKRTGQPAVDHFAMKACQMIALATVEYHGQTLGCLERGGRYFPLSVLAQRAGLADLPGSVIGLFDDWAKRAAQLTALLPHCQAADGLAPEQVRVLAPLGLVFDSTSPWLEVTACVGSPGCERSRADVRAEAARVAESGSVDGAVHYVGCERACGRPAAAEVLVATDDGYHPLPPPP
jgi:hypothetical protein